MCVFSSIHICVLLDVRQYCSVLSVVSSIRWNNCVLHYMLLH